MAVFSQIREVQTQWQLLSDIHADQEIKTAARAAIGDACESSHCRFTETGGQIADDKKAIGFGDLTGLLVVLSDRLKFVAQVFLNDVFNMFRQVGQTLLDMTRLGPDATGHQQFIEIRQMHESGETLSETNRIQNGKPHLAGGKTRQESQHDVLKNSHRFITSCLLILNQQRTIFGKDQGSGKCELLRAIDMKSLILSKTAA